MREAKFGYSRTSCLDSSHSILLNYLTLRRVGNTQLHCRVTDFGAFTAAVTILLLHIQDSSLEARPERRGDIGLVQRILRSMDGLAKSSKRESVAQQSADVLAKLLNYHKADPSASRNLQLTVPYFGTVTITMPNISNPTLVEPPYAPSAVVYDTTSPIAFEQARPNQRQQPVNYCPDSTANVEPFHVSFGPQFTMGGTENGDLHSLSDLDAILFDGLLEHDLPNWDWNQI
ncbi:hypothetical protein BU26DRAFT_609854 [Trematosphaeria pertusa]|uniref:Uncharacterized protein n=1 Tax=Trematosphaeria pertusa TaxID=390896 RepID=A0A6A6HWB9_9PLEO|nr:uncharacterized protein BU26DRAFT_609854 [Trematosphaeria pertusa]KAF2242504.1 hypothetical protein BU26DRAFT_609854 [Trematosphaeria pertusa]